MAITTTLATLGISEVEVVDLTIATKVAQALVTKATRAVDSAANRATLLIRAAVEASGRAAVETSVRKAAAATSATKGAALAETRECLGQQTLVLSMHSRRLVRAEATPAIRGTVRDTAQVRNSAGGEGGLRGVNCHSAQ